MRIHVYLPAHHPVSLTGSVDSLQRYVKNAKLDKDQRSGHTESHKDVQCLEFFLRGGAEGGWTRKRMRGWDEGERLGVSIATGGGCMDEGDRRRRHV